MSEDDEDRFLSILRQLDNEYVELSNSTSDTKGKKVEREVAADDAEGVRSIFQNVAGRKKKKPE